MAEHEEKMCPLCEGHGKVAPERLAEMLTSPELRKRLDARIGEILVSVELAGVGGKVRDFQKEVHSWNPTLPIWRRSPKE